MKRILSLFIAVTFLVCISSVPAFAASEPRREAVPAVITMTAPGQQSQTFLVDLYDCVSVAVDKSGKPVPTPKIGITTHDIGPYGGKYYYTAHGTSFVLSAGTQVSFSVRLKSSASVKMGYVKDGNEVVTTEVASSNPSTTITIPANGNYAFMLRNNTGNTITVSGGSISY